MADEAAPAPKGLGEPVPGFQQLSKAQIEEVIDEILGLYSEGASRRRIVATIGGKYGLSYRMVDEYSSRARKILAQTMAVQREEFVAQQLAAIDELADKATQEKQYSAACGARNLLLKVTGSIPKDN